MKKLIGLGIGVNVLCILNGFKHYSTSKKKDLKQKDDLLIKSENNKFLNEVENFKKENSNISQLNQLTRKTTLESLTSKEFDILIIGGGCNGAGVLLNAYEKGFKCALIEENDFASGSSSRSTKLIHGGIRYLQDVFSVKTSNRWDKLKLVFEALNERDFLINSTPFMSSIIEIKIPCNNYFIQWYYYMGVFVYQSIYTLRKFPSTGNTFPWPNLYPKSVTFFEGQMFDSRQCLLTILTCMRSNTTRNTSGVVDAECLNYISFRDYIFKDNKIIGIKAFDKINKKEIEIYSKCIVNCTGIYGDNYLNKEDKVKDKLITTSKGVHIVVKKELFNSKDITTGYMLPHTTDGRVLFVLPYQSDYFIIGTTDTEQKKTQFIKSEFADIEYIINELKISLNMTEDQINSNITSSWAGLRALVRSPELTENDIHLESKSLARNHVIRYDHQTGLISLLGGKWTTYRKMGQDVLDFILGNNLLSCESQYENKISKLTGGDNPYNNFNSNLSYLEEKEFYEKFENYLIDKYKIDKKIVHSLITRYGMYSEKILEIDKSVIENINTPNERFVIEDQDNETKILTAELIYSVRYEHAIKPNDFICRRTGIAFVNEKLAENSIEKVANMMGKELKWNKNRVYEEIEEAKKNIIYLI